MHIFSCAAAVVCAIPLVLATPMPYGSTSGPDASNGAVRSLRPRHITARAPKSLLPISLAAKKCDNSRECGELHGQCKAAVARIDVTAVYSKPTTFTSLIPGPEKKGGCAVSLACKDNNFGAGITGQQVALLFQQLYTDAGGAHCQECGSGEVDGVVGLPDNNCMVQAVFCKDCKDVNIGTPGNSAPLRPSPARSNLPFASLPPFPGPSSILPPFPMGTGTPDGLSFEPIFDDGLSGNPPFDLRILDVPLQYPDWPTDSFDPRYPPRRNSRFPWIPADWSLRPDPPVNFLGDPSWWDSTTGPSTGGTSPWGPDSNTGFGSPMSRPRPSNDAFPPTFPGGSLDGPPGRLFDPNTGSPGGPGDPSMGPSGGFTDPNGGVPPTGGAPSPGGGTAGTFGPGSPDTSGGAPGLSGGGSMGTPGSPTRSSGTSPPSNGGDSGSPANVPGSPGGSSSSGAVPDTPGSSSGDSGVLTATPSGPSQSSGGPPTTKGRIPGSLADVPVGSGGTSGSGGVPDTPGSQSGNSSGASSPQSGSPGGTGGNPGGAGTPPGSPSDSSSNSGGSSGAQSATGNGPSPPSGSNSGGTPSPPPPPTGATASVAPPANSVASAANTVSGIPTIPGQSAIF